MTVTLQRQQYGKRISEIGEILRGIPFDPQGNPWLNMVTTSKPDLSKFSQYIPGFKAHDAYPYPEEFEKVVFPSLDGTPLVGVLGLHHDGRRRPGVVFCHGLLGSKNKSYIMEAAVEAFKAWDYNVFAPDLRNFGESLELSDCPTTGGWKEGQDILGACRFLGELEGVTSVAAVGFSLGGGSVMNAAFQNSEHHYITGGALAWSGYASMERMMSQFSSRPALGDPFFPIYAMFVCLSEMRRLDMNMKGEDANAYLGDKLFSPDYMRYLREIVAPYYGISLDELYSLSSPMEFISSIGVPLLLVHAEDDPVCPVEGVEELRQAADGNPNVDIWVMPTGAHCAFRGFDEGWYWSVMRGFLDYWADRPAEVWQD